MKPHLTTDQIRAFLLGVPAGPRDWEDVFEAANFSGDPAEDRVLLVTTTYLMDRISPGVTWTADDFRHILDNCLFGRWGSFQEIAAIRAHEDHEDGKISDDVWAKLEDDQAAMDDRLRNHPGAVVIDAVGMDGVVVFGDVFYDHSLRAPAAS